MMNFENKETCLKELNITTCGLTTTWCGVEERTGLLKVIGAGEDWPLLRLCGYGSR